MQILFANLHGHVGVYCYSLAWDYIKQSFLIVLQADVKDSQEFLQKGQILKTFVQLNITDKAKTMERLNLDEFLFVVNGAVQSANQKCQW